ncbi:hypothetical protein [Sphingomonas sp. 3-13AW]|uniref:hypothetical protein n=1 Tax=Sphingomonas sp. 3-13AW TaxID=3050450 RepID=UPI003BB5DE17
MAYPIPITVQVDVSCKEQRYGHFEIIPYGSGRGGSFGIVFWRLYRDHEMIEFNDVLIVEVIPPKLRSRILLETFEAAEADERTTLPVQIEIDGEEWTFQTRARELEFQEVHYEIQIGGEWYRMSETYLRDFIEHEQLIIAEREVQPQVEWSGAGDEY